MALSANKVRDVYGEDGRPESIPAAANAVWYNGSIIVRNSSGYGAVGTDAASVEVVGVADGGGNNTGGANGAVDIKLRHGQVEGFTAPNLAITDVGKDAVLIDDETVAGATEGTNDVPVGRIVAYRNSKAYVHVCVFRGSLAT
ncbi:hypothetical protein [Sandaracinus amylolyticus]|uniref:Uncharacterized protein n=1 Tax=Sandaracinus amylolyticus TaxID=927083 RepID=A0A0F6YKJ7_9BACT|nr:hypothetical protein [Sandaracinus amylolyticus]AKF08882.1 hypothetical protein DB32_006031 [Sandaracinus amylolyticus]